MGGIIVEKGFTLVSGNAEGADQAWARGANKVNPSRVMLYLPWKQFNAAAVHPDNTVHVLAGPYPESDGRYFDLAAAVHPAWSACAPAARRCLARNGMIVENTAMVLGYIDDSGGTTTAFKIARKLGIAPNNVRDESVRAWIEEFFRSAA